MVGADRALTTERLAERLIRQGLSQYSITYSPYVERGNGYLFVKSRQLVLRDPADLLAIRFWMRMQTELDRLHGITARAWLPTEVRVMGMLASGPIYGEFTDAMRALNLALAGISPAMIQAASGWGSMSTIPQKMTMGEFFERKDRWPDRGAMLRAEVEEWWALPWWQRAWKRLRRKIHGGDDEDHDTGISRPGEWPRL